MKLLLGLISIFGLSFLNHSTAQESSPRRVPGLHLSLESYPIISDTTVSKDGAEFPLAYRKPIGEGPFPVVLFFHGGRGSKNESQVAETLSMATPTRFLKKGYMVVAATRRVMEGYKTENPSSFTPGMVDDGVAAVEKAKMLPGADHESIVIYGGSSGGSLAIETAAQTVIAALVVGEPTSLMWMGIGRTPNYWRHDVFPSLYTEETQSIVRSVLGKIDCPFLLLDSDPTGFDHADFRYVMRELVDLKKRAKLIAYAGYKHGFYFGQGARQMTAQELDEVIEDTHTFILPHLRTKPKPL